MGDEQTPDEQTPDEQARDGEQRQTEQNSQRFGPAARWSLVFAVVMVALVVAIWPRGDADVGPAAVPTQAPPSSGANSTDLQVSEDELAAARVDAALDPCPENGQPAAPGSVLTGVMGNCLADGNAYDVGIGTAGKPLVINMWATWCWPCREELPVLGEFAARAADQVDVLAVHAEQGGNNPYLVLAYLTENNVHLPTVLDSNGHIAAALQAPRVFPSTILVRPDGTVAKILPQIFADSDELAAAVDEHLGVSV